MQLTMVGAGYVGLVTGACLADFGHRVVCVDKDIERIAALNNGVIPIFEPGLERLVNVNRDAGRLVFSTNLEAAVSEADAVFIAVGTPARRGDGYADVSFVREAARHIASALAGYTIVVTKSTVPVGTGDEVESIIRSLRPDADFTVVSNPEFLREGAAIEDFKRPNRIVVGTDDPRAREVMAELYRPLYLNQSPMFFTDRRSSELIKYAANAFLAAKVTFINEIADLCEEAGADIQDVARAIGMDNRIGSKFLHPGPGFGGSCFPKDTIALLRTAEHFGVSLRVVAAVVEANDRRKRIMADRIIDALGTDIGRSTVALLGLSFKPNTDDVRDSPALTIIGGLERAGVAIRAYDPEAMSAVRQLHPSIYFAKDPYDCAAGADAVVIITEWDAFRALDLPRLKEALRRPVVVDLRNVYRPAELQALGFTYHSIGRGTGSASAADTTTADMQAAE